MLSTFTALLPCLQLSSFSLAAEQKVLNNHNGIGPLTPKFGQLAKQTLELFHVPGVSIAVVDGDNVWAEGYGIAAFPSTPVTPSTLFYCGSTTKAFTTAAISLLIDNSSSYSNIQWSTPISSLIRDDFVLENDYATLHTTVEDMLSHRSGLPRHDLSYGGFRDGRKATVKDTVRDLRYLKLTAEPRTRFQYCNLMFVVASHVLESLTGVWLGAFLRERIWEPLGMKSTICPRFHLTYFSTPDAQAAPEFLAQGYVYYKDKYQPVPYMDLTTVAGAGSVVSNVLDYTKWVKALLNTSGPISKRGYKAMLGSRSIIEKSPDDKTPFTGPETYALGWFSGTYQGHEFFTHSGGMEAFGAEVIFFPKLKYGIVSLGNTAWTSNAVEERLMWHLIDDKIGVPMKERFDWNKRNLETVKEKQERYHNALEIFYPKVPSPPMSASLPISNYTGRYYNPGYHNMTLSLKDEKLFVDRSDHAFKISADLEHVSGDHFIAYVDSLVAPGPIFRRAAPAEFKVGGDGVSRAFGIMIEPEMGIDSRIWFERVGESED